MIFIKKVLVFWVVFFFLVWSNYMELPIFDHVSPTKHQFIWFNLIRVYIIQGELQIIKQLFVSSSETFTIG